MGVTARSSWRLACGFMVLCAGCGGAAVGSASGRDALRAIRAAVASGDARAIYGLLSTRGQHGEGFQAFRERLASVQPELHDMADALGVAARKDLPIVVDVPLRDGSSASVLLDSGGLHIGSVGLDQTVAPTALDAARGLRSALLRGIALPVWSVLSSSARGAALAEMRSLIDALEDPTEIRVERASNSHSQYLLYLRTGQQLHMVREGGQWRVDSVE